MEIVLDKKLFDKNKKYELNVVDKSGNIKTFKKQIDLFRILKTQHDFHKKEERDWAVQNGLFESFWYDYDSYPSLDQMNARGMSVPKVLEEIVLHQREYGLDVISAKYDNQCIYNVMENLKMSVLDSFNDKKVIKNCKSAINDLKKQRNFYRGKINLEEKAKINRINRAIAYQKLKDLPNFVISDSENLKNIEINIYKEDLADIVELLYYMYLNAKGLETPETLKEEKEEANFNPLVMEFKMAKDYFKSNYEGLNKYKKEMLGRLNKSDYIKAFRVFNLMYLNKYTEE